MAVIHLELHSSAAGAVGSLLWKQKTSCFVYAGMSCLCSSCAVEYPVKERSDVGLSLMSSALHCVPPGEGLLLLCAWQAVLGAMELSSLWLLSSAGSSPLHICAFFPLQPSKRGTSAGGSPTSAQMPVFTEFASSFVLGPPLNAAGQAEHGWGAAVGLGRDGAAVGLLLQQRR